MIDLLLQFDIALSQSAIGFTTKFPMFARLVHLVVVTPETKGLIPVLVFWYLWFRPSTEMHVRRSMLVAVLYIACLAIALGRLLAFGLPFRLRPLASPDVMGSEVSVTGRLLDWSAMPSDHALAFFALAAGMWLVSRRAGALLLCHALLIVCASRVFAGLHYPSDIIVGAGIACIAAFGLVPICGNWFVRAQARYPHAYQAITRPEIGYPLLALVTFEFATLFDGLRMFGAMLGHLLRGF
mgnify:FL=1